MKVEYVKHITRQMVRDNPDKIFLFGDNFARAGYGGQAREMRGEPNAVGIPTKRIPSNHHSAFLSDAEYEYNCFQIDLAFALLKNTDKTIVIPADGIGTGLAQLETKAPRTFEYLQKRLKALSEG